jgi:hypothetical protein
MMGKAQAKDVLRGINTALPAQFRTLAPSKGWSRLSRTRRGHKGIGDMGPNGDYRRRPSVPWKPVYNMRE